MENVLEVILSLVRKERREEETMFVVIAQVFPLLQTILALTCSCFGLKEPGDTKGIKHVAPFLEELIV